MRVKSTFPQRKLESVGDDQQIISDIEDKHIEQDISPENVPVSETTTPVVPVPSLVATTVNEAPVSTPSVKANIEQYKKENPQMYGWEIRERLVAEGITTNPPSISTINRLVRTKESELAAAELTRRQQVELQSPGMNNIQLPTSLMSGLLHNQNIDMSPLSPYLSALQSALLNNLMIQQPASPFSPVYPASPISMNSSGYSYSAPGTPEKLGRMTYNKEQLDILEAVYTQDPSPKLAQREFLATKINIPEKKLQSWFANRRARDRKHGSKGNIKSDPYYPLVNTPSAMPNIESNPVKFEESFINVDE